MCVTIYSSRTQRDYGSARAQDSSFRMVQHEYVFDETVSRRFVRRYHDSGAQTIFLGLGARSDPAVQSDSGRPRRGPRGVSRENIATMKPRTRVYTERPDGKTRTNNNN